jgi:hypothetical protein
MAINSMRSIKNDIEERIEINYSRSFDFYHGYILALYMADIINTSEYKELRMWIESLDLK